MAASISLLGSWLSSSVRVSVRNGWRVPCSSSFLFSCFHTQPVPPPEVFKGALMAGKHHQRGFHPENSSSPGLGGGVPTQTQVAHCADSVYPGALLLGGFVPSECCCRDYSQAVTVSGAPCGSLASCLISAAAAALLLLPHLAGNKHLPFSSSHTWVKSRKSVLRSFPGIPHQAQPPSPHQGPGSP